MSIPALPMALLPAILGALAFVAALLVTARATAGHPTDLGAGWTAWSASVDAHHLDALFGMSLGLLSSATALLLLFRSSARLRTRCWRPTMNAEKR